MQELAEFEKLSVLWVAQPREDFNTVLLLALKVVFYVVNDDRLLEIPVQQGEVLDVNTVVIEAVVPVEPMVDVFLLLVDVVQYEVGVVLGSCRENDYFEVLRHILQELDAAGSQLELLLLGHKVHQSLVEIKYQRVFLQLSSRWQVLWGLRLARARGALLRRQHYLF